MKDYKTLIADIRTEACELADKLKRLEVFMMSEDYLELSPEQKGLLGTQYDLMGKYKVTLVKRAHRINYEHAQNAGKEMPEPEKEVNKNLDADKEDYPDHLCIKCRYYFVSENGYSGCHHPHPDPAQRGGCWELK